MEQSYYRIGEVSRATGLSKDTLHFYDKIGLLSPDHVDPQNGYRYYSLRNLWQLDIITTCRKLNIPLDTVRQILSLQDNAEIVRLLMEYREEALRRSAYYQQVAEDILWYKEEHRRIEAQKDDPPLVRQVWREAEQVIAGRAAQGGSQAYHVNMQQAAQAELQQAASIRRRYGYLLDGAGTGLGILIARMDGCGDTAAQRDTIKSGLWLGVFNFALFACVSLAVLQGYFALSSDQPMVRQQGIQYAQVVLAGSLGLFIESHCTKLLQARGNTLVPIGDRGRHQHRAGPHPYFRPAGRAGPGSDRRYRGRPVGRHGHHAGGGVPQLRPDRPGAPAPVRRRCGSSASVSCPPASP